jgi:hypothetical protein
VSPVFFLALHKQGTLAVTVYFTRSIPTVGMMDNPFPGSTSKPGPLFSLNKAIISNKRPRLLVAEPYSGKDNFN